MLQFERHQQIVAFVNEKKQTTTDQLAEFLSVSKQTIRRDIDVLSRNGLLRKVHGGAVSLSDSPLHEIPYASKVSINATAKQKIGITAAKMVDSEDVIILDSGSTTMEIAKNLTTPNITVLTNDIQISIELASKDNINIIMPGGLLEKSVYTLTGNASIDFFKKIHVNKLFLGCDAFDMAFGVSDRNAESAAAKQAMIRAADKVIMTTDYSKLGKKAFCYVCSLSDIDTLVTNQCSDQELRHLQEQNVEVVLT